jgi:hypothetical protein
MKNFEIKIKKLPLFSKQNQTIRLTEIEHFRVSEGKAIDRIIIELNKENIRISTDNFKKLVV